MFPLRFQVEPAAVLPDIHVEGSSHGRQAKRQAPAKQSAAIKSLLEAQSWPGALWLLEEPTIDKSRRLKALNGCLSACGRASQWRQGLRLMHAMRDMPRMPGPTSVSLSALSLACERARQWPMVLQLLDLGRLERLLGRQGKNPSRGNAELAVWTAACRACDQANRWRASMEILPEMLTGAGLEPNVFTFATAFQVCQHGLGDRAVELFQEMRRRSLEPSVLSCNQALGACAQSGLWEAACSLLEGARQLSLEPSSASVSSALRGRPWRSSLELLAAARRLRVECNELTVAAALSSWGSSWQKAQQLLQHQREQSEGDLELGFGLLRADWEEALARLRFQKASVASVSGLAERCLTAEVWHYAAQLVTQLRDRTLQPDKVSLAVQLRAHWRLALASAKAANAEEELDDEAAIFVASQVLATDWSLALSVLPANARAENLRLRACVMGGHWQQALAWLLERHEVPVDVSVTNAVCTKLDELSQWSLALWLLDTQDLPSVDFKSFESSFQMLRSAREALASHVKKCESLHENIDRQLKDLQRARPNVDPHVFKEKLLAAEQLYSEVKSQREASSTAEADAKEKTSKAQASTARMKTLNDELRRYDQELHELRAERKDKETKAALLRSKANTPGLEDRKKQVQEDIDRNLEEAREMQVIGRRVQQGEDGYLSEGQSRDSKIAELTTKLNELKRHHQQLLQKQKELDIDPVALGDQASRLENEASELDLRIGNLEDRQREAERNRIEASGDATRESEDARSARDHASHLASRLSSVERDAKAQLSALQPMIQEQHAGWQRLLAKQRNLDEDQYNLGLKLLETKHAAESEARSRQQVAGIVQDVVKSLLSFAQTLESCGEAPRAAPGAQAAQAPLADEFDDFLQQDSVRDPFGGAEPDPFGGDDEEDPFAVTAVPRSNPSPTHREEEVFAGESFEGV
ncbi:unnamed protein product [Effrenium voratum]|uniref:Pentatricopeptide repeat-containing protein, chloroplastic n=1 Tax=Effrenium voratum TaxID=2562239 RepID=A0AA36NLN8_9DINO|nr:unnamed protein product [Effrenium voratum]